MEKERRNGCFSEEEVDLLKLQFTDLFGQLKMVEMTGGQAEKAIKEGYAINRYALGGLRCEGAAPDSETLKDRAGKTWPESSAMSWILTETRRGRIPGDF